MPMRHILLTLASLLLMAGPAQANQGLFGGRTAQDGSLNMRQSTIEQFDPIRGQSVAQRPRPDFDPTPISIGSFQLFPSLNIAGYYDSNIYANRTASKSDFVWKATPMVSVASNWGRHALAFTAMGDLTAYSENSRENYAGGAMQAEDRFDFTQQTWLAASLSYQRVTEPRSSPSLPGAADEPAQYNLYKAHLQGYRGVGILQAKADYDFSYTQYGKLALSPTGSTNLDVRNRVSHGVTGELAYEVTRNFIPFVQGGLEWRTYDRNSLRNSIGSHAQAGARFDIGGMFTAEAYIGFLGRDYTHFANGGVAAFDFGGKALWNITELTSLQGEVSRLIDETTYGGATLATASNASLATGGSLTLTHELQRNIILEANASYTHTDYQLSSRSDNVMDVGLGARYYLNRNYYTDLNYDYITRSSSAAGADYNRHILLLRVGAQY